MVSGAGGLAAPAKKGLHPPHLYLILTSHIIIVLKKLEEYDLQIMTGVLGHAIVYWDPRSVAFLFLVSYPDHSLTMLPKGCR